MDAHHVMRGSTIREISGLSNKAMEGNRVIRSCLCYFPLAYMQRLIEYMMRWKKRSTCLLSLDDIYVVAAPERVATIYGQLADALWNVAGIRLNEGKTRVWNRGGVCPPDVHQLGEHVWCPERVNVLGTPIGTKAFVDRKIEERIADEQRLWDAIPKITDLQCAWQVLLQCAGPRANHMLRTLPPTQVAEYAKKHDDGMWATVCKLLGELPGERNELAMRAWSRVPMFSSPNAPTCTH